MAGSAIVGTLRALLSADVAEFVTSMGRSADASEKFEKQLTATGQTFKEAGIRMSAVKGIILDFSGALDHRKAEEYAAALMKMSVSGNAVDAALKLTAADQEKVNQVMTEAIGHYQDLSKAPAHLVALQNATKGVQAPTENLLGSVTKLAGAFGLAFTGAAVISGIKNLIGNVFDTASAIHDQAEALGFSTEAFQRNQFAAEQSGGSLEDFSRAANKLNDNLAGGSASTVAALTKAGLKFDEIRQMKPEEAWAKVTDAVGKIEDPMTRANVAQDLFGKGALHLLPGMIEGYQKLGEEATIMSDETIKRLEAAQDAWDKLGKTVTIWTGELIAKMLKFSQQNMGLREEQDKLQQSVDRFIAQAPKHAGAFTGLTPHVKSADEALAAFEKSVGKTTTTTKANTSGIDAYAKAVQDLANVYTGRHLDAEVLKIADAVTKAGGAEKITTAEGEKLVKQLRDFEAQGAKLPPVLEAVIGRFEGWHTAGLKVQAGLGSILKLLPNVTKAVEDDSVAWLKEEAAWVKTLSTVAALPAGFVKLTQVNIKDWGKDATVSIDTLSATLDYVAQSFAQLSQIGGDGFSEISKAIGGTVIALNGITKAMDLASKGGFDAKKVAALASTWIGVAVAIAEVSIAIAKHVQKAHQISNSIKDIGNEMGESISNGLATGIAAMADALKKLDSSLTSATARHYAELLNLDKIIGETGGLNSKNLAHWTEQAERLFEVVKRGGELGAKASAELVTVIGMFAKQAESTGGVWDEAFKKLITDTKALGIGIDEINALVQGQQTKLVSGAVGVTAAIGAEAQSYLALKKAVDDAAKGDDPEALVTAQAALAAAVVVTQGEFDRLSRISFAAFNTLVASGVGSVEAMGEVGAGIDNLIKVADTFGLSGNAAFESLKRWRELTEANAPLLEQLGNLNDILIATANLNGLTTEGFADMQAQGLSAFAQLTAAGLSQIEAEMAMKPLLESIIKLHEDRGLAIDEETQKLIDQATADGVLKAKQISTNDILIAGFKAIIKAVGGDIPDAFEDMAAAGKDAANKISGAFDNLDIHIPVSYDYSSSGTPPSDAGGDMTPSFAHEGFIRGARKIVAGDWPAGEFVLHAETVQALVDAAKGGSYAPTLPAMMAPTLPSGGGFHAAIGGSAAFAGAGASLEPMYATTVINLDGRQVARSTAQFARRAGYTKP